MNTYESLYKAILRHPEEDTPRLMYADWLDENDQPERAEFIRLQVALAWPDSQLPQCSVCEGRGKDPHQKKGGATLRDCPACNGDGTARNAMRLRVAELWTQSVWKQLSSNGVHFVHAEPAAPIMPPQRLTAVASRGFVGGLYFPRMSSVCERARVACRACEGKGYVFTKNHSIFSRQGHNICADCRTCRGMKTLAEGDWQFTKTALDLAREHPIQRVWVGDAVPEKDWCEDLKQPLYFWHTPASGVSFVVGYELPPIIFSELPIEGDSVKQFATEAEALDALAVAIAKALRTAAGVSQ